MSKALNQKPVRVEVKSTQFIDVTPRFLAEIFCGMNDEQQAQFFIDCADISKGWDTQGSGGAGYQWWLIGKHLRTCECSTEDAREMIREVHGGLTP